MYADILNRGHYIECRRIAVWYREISSTILNVVIWEEKLIQNIRRKKEFRWEHAVQHYNLSMVHEWPAVFPHKRPMMRKVFLYIFHVMTSCWVNQGLWSSPPWKWFKLYGKPSDRNETKFHQYAVLTDS